MTMNATYDMPNFIVLHSPTPKMPVFCNKSISNMPLNVIKERKIKLSANKFYQTIHKMQCFLQNFIR